MKNFTVGAKVNNVRVYAHSFFEHFNQTVQEMEIKSEIAKTVEDIKSNVRQSVSGIGGRVRDHEKKYLKILGFKNKDQYFEAFANPQVNSDFFKARDAMFEFTDQSIGSKEDLEEALVRRFGGSARIGSQAAVKSGKADFTIASGLKKIHQAIISESKPFFQETEKYFKGIMGENAIIANKGVDQTSFDAVVKRQEALRSSIERLKLNKTPPKTLKESVSRGGAARGGTYGLGVAYELIAGILVDSIHGSARTTVDNIALVGDEDEKGKREKFFTTDATVKLGEMTIGIDVKSNKVLYKKDTRKEGMGYDLLSAIFLGTGGSGFAQLGNKGGMKGTKIKGLLSSPNPEFLKQLIYILVNDTVFQSEGKGLSNVMQANDGLKQLFIIAGMIDFIVKFISNATKEGEHSQLLLLLGEKIIFTSDFIDHIVEMIEGIVAGSGAMYGITYKLLDEGRNNIGEGLKGDLLKEKLMHIRQGSTTYDDIFKKVGNSDNMKGIVSKALNRSMLIKLKIPMTAVFSKRAF